MLQTLSHGSNELGVADIKQKVDAEAIWYDLYRPEPQEVEFLKKLGISVPSLEEISEIEESSRLYEENGILFMTAFLIASADTDHPFSVPVAFILTPKCLVTVRYTELKVFQIFAKKVSKNGFHSPQLILAGLLETIVERLADIQEMNATQIEQLSHEIFKRNRRTDSVEMRGVLIHLGKIGSINSKVRESLMTLDRLLIFSHTELGEEIEKKVLNRLETIHQDIRSLVDYVSFLFSKVEFLLNASLGFINIEQNSIIKFFSVAAVIFLPPMVIASIYGMNFKLIPELNWAFGYPLALILMVLSAILPYYWFKRKGWI